MPEAEAPTLGETRAALGEARAVAAAAAAALRGAEAAEAADADAAAAAIEPRQSVPRPAPFP